MARRKTENTLETKKTVPATSVKAREDQLISLAVDLAEQQLRDGTASAQVIAHFLKLGTTKASLEKEKLEKENELLKAKTESLQSSKRSEELYAKAINAIQRYSGQEPIDESEML